MNLLKPMDKTLDQIRRIEFEQIDYHTESHDYFGFIEGKIPILISAPHGARHLRDGSWKEEDEYTSSIAIKLAELTGAHAIYVKNRTTEDPNHDKAARYKFAIKKAVKDYGIKFLVDLHGARKERDFKVCVGIISEEAKKCSCPSFKAIIEEIFSDFQNPIFNIDRELTASSPRTVTYFARHTCGIESAQFEIHLDYRIIERKEDSSKAIEGEKPKFKAKEKDVLELLNHLKEMILGIKEKIER